MSEGILPVVAAADRARDRADTRTYEPADAGEFERFYAEHYPPVAGYALQLTRDEDVARDIAQEAFTRLLTRWRRIREPRPYLYLTVTNLVRDRWLAQARGRRLLVRLAPVDEAGPAPDRGVADAVSRLPRRHREVVLLHYYADMPLAEVAAVLHRPEGTVKRLLAEARTRLSRTLGDSHG